jgi:hypothetical protein
MISYIPFVIMSAASGGGKKSDAIAGLDPRPEALPQSDILAVDQDDGPGEQLSISVQQFIQEALPGFFFRQVQQFHDRQLIAYDL